MRFARHAKIFRGPLDAAPVAGVLLLLMMFMLLSALIYTPGVQITLPVGKNLTGTDNATVEVAVDFRGLCFYENRLVQDAELKTELARRVKIAARDSKSLTMILMLDKAAEIQVLTHFFELAHEAGIAEVELAERPAAFGPRP